MDKLRILLADDHEIVRDGLKMLINAQPDMEVVAEASEGGAAVERATQANPDVVVMDVSMPGMSSLSAILALRHHHPPLNVLALTRHREGGYLHQVLRAGATGYVLKQSRAVELLRAIRVVAGGGSYVDPAVTAEMIGAHYRDSVVSSTGGLTVREEQVLRLIALGYSNKEIAARLLISVKTVETHKMNGMQKLGMRGRVDLVQFAQLQRWFEAA
jgi:two-component system, NarL family, response regulator NreC